jgi:streptogramin lyase
MSVIRRALTTSTLAVIAAGSLVAAADPSPLTTVTPVWESVEPSLVIDVPNADGAINLATDGKTVWAVGQGEILRIDDTSGAVQHLPAPVATGDTFLLLADDGLWATRWDGGKVYRLDPATGSVELDVDLPHAVAPNLVDGALWVGREDLSAVFQVDRTTGALGSPLRLGAYGWAGPGELWFASKGPPPTVTRVDPASGLTLGSIEVPPGTGCAVGGTSPGSVFTSCFEREVTARPFARIDPGTNSVVATTMLPGTHGAAPVALDGQTWLVGSFEEGDGTPFGGMVRLDPASGAVERWISLGDVDPNLPVATEDAIWVGDEAGHRILRYDTERLAGP